MTDRATVQTIIREIKKANSIAIYCHLHPDCDTIASALALKFALVGLGKNADVVCESDMTAKLLQLDGANTVIHPPKMVYDLSISVDVSSIDMLGLCVKSFLSAPKRIAIDHHPSHAKFADVVLLDSKASACAEILFEFLDEQKLIDQRIAKLLYAGIVTDSGCFQFSSVSARTHNIAYQLLQYDFDAGKVVYDVFKKTPRATFNLKNRVLSKAKFFDDGKIAMITFRREDFEATDTSDSDTEGIILNLIDVDGVQVAFSIAETTNPRSFKVSVRTKDKADAADIASQFGGGGHKQAAGCRLNGFYEDVVDKLLKAARDRI